MSAEQRAYLVVVAVVQDVDKISIERVNVVKDGELVQYHSELVMIALRCELHLADVEATDALDGVALVHHYER